MRANIAILKNSLSRYVKAVRDGEEVVVMDRDQPVARLVPYRAASQIDRRSKATADLRETNMRLEELARRGAVTHQGDPLKAAAWAMAHEPMKLPANTPAPSELWLQMRDEERW